MTVDRSDDATLPRRLPHSISYSRVGYRIDRWFVWGFPCLATGIDCHRPLTTCWGSPPLASTAGAVHILI